MTLNERTVLRVLTNERRVLGVLTNERRVLLPVHGDDEGGGEEGLAGLHHED